MKNPHTTILMLCLAVPLLFANCSNESVEIAEGGEGEACYADGTCELGLLCNDAGLCEKEEEPDSF
ncbi:MAG: hypothetical protein JRF33_25595 [Deltaproteobacteria bacterium]|nr:hypothetical protein [Deltaproteobacteria bacterium]